MSESESSVHEHAEHGEDAARRICTTLVQSKPKYQTWVASHDQPMWRVARARTRDAQQVQLRLVAIHQIHRAALVRHLRDQNVSPRVRRRLFTEFHGVLDSDCAVLAEHRSYMQAVSSQLCATDLLELTGDRHGLRLLDAYQNQYGTYFAMHCDRLLARSRGRSYLLSYLMPDVSQAATRLKDALLTIDETRTSRSGIFRPFLR